MRHTMGSRLLSLLLAFSLCAAVSPAALAEEETGAPSLERVSLEPGSAALKVGQTQVLTASVILSDGTTELPEGFSVDWSVADGREDEVSVTPAGSNSLTATAEAMAVPETTEDETVAVTVTVTPPVGMGEAQKDTCTITVSPADPTGISVTPTTLELAPGYTGRLSATVVPDTAPQTVTWRSEEKAVASVDQSGTVTGVAAGKTRIFAVSSTQEAACTVTVQGIVLDKDALEDQDLKVGDRYELGYTLYGPSLQGKGVTWTTSDAAVVRVDSGYLYAVSEGTAVITAKVNGFSNYTDSVTVTVKRSTAAVITASAGAGDPLDFSGLRGQFQNRASVVLGESLSYISGLSVPTDQGTLYYRYTSGDDTGAGVGTAERYYVSSGSGQMGLSDLTFVPKGDFSGTAVISYTGYASGTRFFQGTVEVEVDVQKDVGYSAANGEAVQFNADDFDAVCRARTGRDLKYVTFSLPDSGTGTLTYQYLSSQYPGTAVRTSTQYYASGTPSLGSVYFVPADGFDGKAVITYTGWDTNRESFQGRVVIQVEEAAAGSGSIRYDVAKGGTVTFDDGDFNAICKDLTGSALDAVRFTLPSASQGTLYYGSTSSSDRVTSSRKYYRTSSPYLDEVMFQAGADFSGAVSIPFTGWSTGGASFTGTVSIRVGADADTISYQTSNGQAVEFDASDFNDVSREAAGGTLRYVRFTLPSSSKGTLYYDYDDGDYAGKVSASTNYYRAQSPYLDRVSFVPAASFSGTVSISYTGWTTGGERFTGTVEIRVISSASAASEIVYTTAYQPVTFRAADFSAACKARGLGTLESVQFVTTSVFGAGRLYSQYDGFRASNSEVRTGTRYYPGKSPDLSSVTFVPRVGYQGTVTLTYTGTDSQNRTYQGQVRIIVSPGSASGYFQDVSYSYGWAAPAVDFLYESGVVNGTGAGQFSPARAITRGSFLAMVDRALSLPRTSYRSFPDVPANSYYADAIQAAYGLGIVDGYSDGNFRPDAPLTRAAACTILYRAMQTVGWSIGAENTALLGAYPDGGAVPAYARGAMSVLLQTGIITGTSAGKLEPGRIMTRAEMAVVLARALTL
ncbi:S-layer homology domain-containing protein [uncultured Oscillibacter sp.]|uniref:S-layer homology domain-containing protein n=1 Tax=uncultured Oscillibacter sp. TaxID=876091 RepID=UPI00280BD59F|nr:S-layer homology domain-containing protein [uncultured Oscillibacter sp.]